MHLIVDKSGKEEKISDLLKAKSRQKFQAWLSKPGDIKFTGGKRDVTTQLMEDLTKHQRYELAGLLKLNSFYLNCVRIEVQTIVTVENNQSNVYCIAFY